MNPNTDLSEIKPIPGPALGKKTKFYSESREPRIWTLYYRYGNIPQITKGFELDGSLHDAIMRGRTHCEKMGYIFLLVRPMLVDLDYQENSYSQGEYKDPDSRRDI